MPCDIGRLPQIAEEDARAYQRIQEVLNESAPWLRGVTGKDLLQEAERGSGTFRLESAAVQLAEKPLLCIAGLLDVYTPPRLHCIPLVRAIRAAGGSMLRSISYPTDHFFSDYRLTVADTVSKYLLGLYTGEQK